MKKWKYYILVALLYIMAIVTIDLIERQSPGANIKSIGDAFWYAIVTLTTVGYGDYFPVTPVGKLVGLLLIIGSIGILGYIIGEITNKFNLYMEKKRNGFWGTNFEGHYIIIGWNDFGRQVAEQIFNSGKKIAFVVNSKNDIDLINDLFDTENCFCMFVDYHNLEAYRKVNIERSKGVFVNFEDDTETLVYVLNLKKAYADIDLVVTCKNADLKETFINAGISYVVAQSNVASRLVASYIFEPQVASLTEDLIASSIAQTDFDIQQYKVVANNQLLGMSFKDIFWKLKNELNVILLAVAKNGVIRKTLDDSEKPELGSYLVVISSGSSKKQLEILFGVNEGK